MLQKTNKSSNDRGPDRVPDLSIHEVDLVTSTHLSCQCELIKLFKLLPKLSLSFNCASKCLRYSRKQLMVQHQLTIRTGAHSATTAARLPKEQNKPCEQHELHTVESRSNAEIKQHRLTLDLA